MCRLWWSPAVIHAPVHMLSVGQGTHYGSPYAWRKLATAWSSCIWRPTVAWLGFNFFPVVSVSICTQGWIQHIILVSFSLVLGKLGPLGQIQSSFIQVNFYWHAYMAIYLHHEWDCYHTIMSWKIFIVCLFIKSVPTLGPQYITF